MNLKKFLIIVLIILSISLVGCSPPDMFSSSSKLSTEYDYSYEYSWNELKKLSVDCDKCDNVNECRYICSKECAKNNLIFEGFTPLIGKPEIDGKCPCLCRPLAHVNEEKLTEAIRKNDYNICNTITLDTRLYTKDYCYLIMAMILEDESICEKIEKQSFANSKDACYSMLAFAKKDISLCSRMVEENDPDTSKPMCEKMVQEGVPAYLSVPK
ncbi:MAG: hypothetical protein KJ968_01735 [Nanoarchaeota archaeon]|nr:hypothetical protein [Nanoarchaeota archaeon]MBU4283803.1 hypothetical protein [Nanoarchaeota archaeon]